MERKPIKAYLLLHLCLLAAILLFPLYRSLTRLIPDAVTGCFLHDRLLLYCPLCGGTRAVWAMLHFDFVAAWQYNAFVTACVPLIALLDLVALVRLLQGKQRLLPFDGRLWVVLVILLIGYAVLRNYLMIARGYDPTGDLGLLWQAIKSRPPS